MTTIQGAIAPSASPHDLITQLDTTDQPYVRWTPVPGSVHPDPTCRYCPPGAPARPVAATLLFQTGGELRRRAVGTCCLLEAVHHHLRRDGGEVTVLYTMTVDTRCAS